MVIFFPDLNQVKISPSSLQLKSDICVKDSDTLDIDLANLPGLKYNFREKFAPAWVRMENSF